MIAKRGVGEPAVLAEQCDAASQGAPPRTATTPRVAPPPQQREPARHQHGGEGVPGRRGRPAVQRRRQGDQPGHQDDDPHLLEPAHAHHRASAEARATGPPRRPGRGRPSRRPSRRAAWRAPWPGRRPPSVRRPCPPARSPGSPAHRPSNRTATSIGASAWSASAVTRCSTIRYAESSTVAGSDRGSPVTVSRERPPRCRASSASRWATVGRRRQRHLAAAQQPDDLPHVVQGLPAARLDRLQHGPRFGRRKAVRGLGRRGQLRRAAPAAVRRAAATAGPVVRDLERGPLVAQLPQLRVADLELAGSAPSGAGRPGRPRRRSAATGSASTSAPGPVVASTTSDEHASARQRAPQTIHALARVGRPAPRGTPARTPAGRPAPHRVTQPNSSVVQHHHADGDRGDGEDAAPPPQHRDRRGQEHRDHPRRVGTRSGGPSTPRRWLRATSASVTS